MSLKRPEDRKQTYKRNFTMHSGTLLSLSLFTARCVSRYSVDPEDRSRPVTITTRPAFPTIIPAGSKKKQQPRIKHTQIRQRRAGIRYFLFCFFNNKYGSSQQRGLTWDVDVPSLMIGEFTPVPLPRRNIRLFHQKCPRHAQLTPGP